MQFTDAYFVAQLGSNELAAISPASLVVLLPLSAGLGLISAVGTFTAQAFGKGQMRECAQFAVQGLWVSAAIGIGFLALIPTAPFAFAVFNHEFAVYELEVAYFRVSILAIGIQMGAMGLAAFFVSIHRPGVAMTGAIVATAANILFDYAFIFGKFGFPNLGFEGAAWGTVAAACVHLVFMLSMFIATGNRGGIRVNRKKATDLIRVGFPLGLQGALDVVSTGIILIWLIGAFGTAHLAAATIVIRCAMISYVPPEGIASGLSALVGRSIGQERRLVAQLQVGIGMKLVVVYIGLIAMSFIVFREQLVGIFTSDPEVARIATIALVLVAVFQLFDSMSIVYGAALRAAGDNLWPMIANVVLCGVVFLGGGLLFTTQLPEWGSLGIWVVDGIYVVVQGFVFRSRWRRGNWKQIALFASPECKAI